MLTDLSPLLHHVTPAVRTDELQLIKNSWVRFSSIWPRDQKTGWASGNTFVVNQDTILVDYPVSRNILNQDYFMLDMTNQSVPTIPGVPHPTAAQQGTFQMYPVNPYVIYQISVGMKKGQYFVQLLIPSGAIPIYQMGSSAIPPNIADPVYRYLGAKYPKDSPANSPTWFLYSIYDAPQIVLNIFMDGGDTEAVGVLYGKATIIFRVNKCPLKQITIGDIASVNQHVGQNQTFSVPADKIALVTGGIGNTTKIASQQGQVQIIGNGMTSVIIAGYTVQTGNGYANITTLDDLRKWQSIQDRALFIPYYTELTNF